MNHDRARTNGDWTPVNHDGRGQQSALPRSLVYSRKFHWQRVIPDFELANVQNPAVFPRGDPVVNFLLDLEARAPKTPRFCNSFHVAAAAGFAGIQSLRAPKNLLNYFPEDSYERFLSFLLPANEAPFILVEGPVLHVFTPDSSVGLASRPLNSAKE